MFFEVSSRSEEQKFPLLVVKPQHQQVTDKLRRTQSEPKLHLRQELPLDVLYGKPGRPLMRKINTSLCGFPAFICRHRSVNFAC